MQKILGASLSGKALANSRKMHAEHVFALQAQGKEWKPKGDTKSKGDKKPKADSKKKPKGIELAGIGTDFQVADVFTKPLAHSKFASFRNVLCGYRTFENLMNSNAEKTAEIRRLCALEFRLLETAGLDGHSLQRYI